MAVDSLTSLNSKVVLHYFLVINVVGSIPTLTILATDFPLFLGFYLIYFLKYAIKRI